MISIILCHHLNENQNYLNATLRSLRAQTNQDFECFVMASSPEKPEITCSENIKLVHDVTLNNATKKAHYAIDNLCSKESLGFLFLSDDVVLCPNYVQGVMDASKNGAIVGGLSNNENFHHFYAGLPMDNNCEYNEQYILWTLRQPMGRLVLINVPWISFYATFIPRQTWERVGRLEEVLDVRGNDMDYCYRANKLDIGTFIHTGIFALHFGSKTLPKTTTSEQLQDADRFLVEKYQNK